MGETQCKWWERRLLHLEARVLFVSFTPGTVVKEETRYILSSCFLTQSLQAEPEAVSPCLTPPLTAP